MWLLFCCMLWIVVGGVCCAFDHSVHLIESELCVFRELCPVSFLVVGAITISCPLWSSVYECQRVECAFTSTVRAECGMVVM